LMEGALLSRIHNVHSDCLCAGPIGETEFCCVGSTLPTLSCKGYRQQLAWQVSLTADAGILYWPCLLIEILPHFE